MKINKVTSVADNTRIELLLSELEKKQSYIDYLSMMTDVEIPIESEESKDE